MKLSRRTILKAGAGTALALAGGPLMAEEKSANTMLILGGTGFIGPHMTQLALSRGWKVTHFNRGKRDPDGVENVETLNGDRKGQLDSLKGRKWDVVVDNTGYIPKYTKMSADLLAPNTGYCLYISSISAYASFAKPNDIGSPTGVLENKDQEEITNETYGPMKALCEQYVRDAYGKRSSIVRPGYIVGPLGRPTASHGLRFAKGGDMAVPGTPADPIQIVDVRDLVAFMMGLVDRRVDGTFNAVTPPGAITMGNLMDTSRKVTGADTKLTWIDEDFLATQMKPEEMNFAPWADARRGGRRLADRHEGLGGPGPQGAVARGDRRDTLAWHETRPAERKAALRSGFTPEQEAEILAAWRARKA
jgi:2'-hydroxyisoflavone reductase